MLTFRPRAHTDPRRNCFTSRRLSTLLDASRPFSLFLSFDKLPFFRSLPRWKQPFVNSTHSEILTIDAIRSRFSDKDRWSAEFSKWREGHARGTSIPITPGCRLIALLGEIREKKAKGKRSARKLDAVNHSRNATSLEDMCSIG